MTDDPSSQQPPVPPAPRDLSPLSAPGTFLGSDFTGSGTGDPILDDTRPEPGSLHLTERRSWKTWQLILAVLIAAVFGMWFTWVTGNEGSATSASSGSGGSTYRIPPPSSSGGPTTTVPGSGSSTTTLARSGSAATTTTAGGSGSSTSTTSAGGSGGSTPTTTAGSPTSSVALAPASVLVPATQLTGSWTSPVFNIAGGTWNIGWAFACSPVPATTPTFEVFVVNAGASPGPSPAVSSTAPSGQSVTPQTTTGQQQIDVHAPTGCRWAVKVTGSSS